MSDQDAVQRQIESIESLVREIERLSDPAARALSKQLVQSLMDLHRAGLDRMLEIVHSAGDLGQQIIEQMGDTEPARSLLLLYGLHPLDLETRVLQALEKTRPYLRSHGGNVELLRVNENGSVVVRLEGNGHGCPSSAATFQSTIEQAIYDAAPDVTSIVVEGVVQPANASFLPLSALQTNGSGNGKARASGDNRRSQDDGPPAAEQKDLEEAQKSAR